MQKILIATSISLALIVSAAANAMPTKPAVCPTAIALQAANFELVQKHPEKETWIAAQLHNNFETEDAWSFAVVKIQADNEADAKAKAEASLASIQFKDGPIAFEKYNVWFCGYSTAEGYFAAAVTPAIGFNLFSALIK